MMKELLIKNNTGFSLLQQLKLERRKLISDKVIPDKKDNNTYPIEKILFDIPSDWFWCYLSDISIIQEGPGIRKHQYSETGIQFLTVTNILEGSVDLEKSKKFISLEEYEDIYKHFTINCGDIVIACSGGSWGKSAIYELNEKIILNTSTLRLRFFSDLGNNKFLYFLTKASFFKDSLSQHLTGQQPNYGYSHYSKIEIPLPPLSIQAEIVTILDEAFAAIAQAKAHTEQNLKNAKELFESFLQGVFENKGDCWEEVTLGNIATFRNGMNFTKISNGEIIKIVGVKDFQKNFTVPLEDLESATIDGKLNEIDFLQENDILAVRSNGNPMLIGRTLLAGNVLGKVSHSGFTIRIRLNSKNILPIYLCHYLKTQKTRKELVDSGNGVGIKSLNQGSLSSLLIPFPKSLKEQQAIIQKINILSAETKRLESLYEQKLKDLEELKKSVLEKAFKGELRAKKG